jgi:multiple sugar transport system substrate-binding protein
MQLAGFPVNRKAAEKAAARGAELPKNGMIRMVGPEGETDLKPASEEEVAAMLKTLEEVNRYDGADREILKIILDEAEAFFKGQKTADEVAGLIQNRVSTYLNE